MESPSPHAPPAIRRQGTRLATLVGIIEEALEDTEANASGSEAASPECVAAVHTDWTRIAPTIAAVTAYAHALKSQHSAKALLIVVPGDLTPVDRAALDVVKDTLPPELGQPKLILASADALDEVADCIHFYPQHDDSDLMALVDFSNRLHDHAESMHRP